MNDPMDALRQIPGTSYAEGLRRERDEARAEVERLREERDTWEQRAIMAEEVAQSAMAEVERLREALDTFGSHFPQVLEEAKSYGIEVDSEL